MRKDKGNSRVGDGSRRGRDGFIVKRGMYGQNPVTKNWIESASPLQRMKILRLHLLNTARGIDHMHYVRFFCMKSSPPIRKGYVKLYIYRV